MTLLGHRIDTIREQCNTLPEDHPMKPFWESIERRLTSQWAIEVAEKDNARTDCKA